MRSDHSGKSDPRINASKYAEAFYCYAEHGFVSFCKYLEIPEEEHFDFLLPGKVWLGERTVLSDTLMSIINAFSNVVDPYFCCQT